MPKIYSAKEPLEFERIRLAKPITKNGAHFIKTLDVDDPIYYLAPKCSVKSGIVSHGKKMYCDFVFSNEDTDFLAWLENLEETAKKGIYANRDKWFETPLDEHDIESSMTPPYKSYKSGKCFIVRANVPTALDKINIKIYNENEEETDPANVKENTNVLAVLELQGIRCGVRSFQFEIELKQLLIVEPEKLFEKCVIGKKDVVVAAPVSTIISEQSKHESPIKMDTPVSASSVPVSDLDTIDEPTIQEPSIAEPNAETTTENVVLTDQDAPIEILDVDFPLDVSSSVDVSTDPPIRLKNRNEVYYKLYKETRQRAREAKREALANYLEARRIKGTYLLDDVSDSDSDLDNFDLDK